METVPIDRDTKIVLLNVLKNNYFGQPELERLIDIQAKNLNEAGKAELLKSLALRWGTHEPIVIEIIDSREKVEKRDSEY